MLQDSSKQQGTTVSTEIRFETVMINGTIESLCIRNCQGGGWAFIAQLAHPRSEPLLKSDSYRHSRSRNWRCRVTKLGFSLVCSGRTLSALEPRLGEGSARSGHFGCRDFCPHFGEIVHLRVLADGCKHRRCAQSPVQATVGFDTPLHASDIMLNQRPQPHRALRQRLATAGGSDGSLGHRARLP